MVAVEVRSILWRHDRRAADMSPQIGTGALMRATSLAMKQGDSPYSPARAGELLCRRHSGSRDPELFRRILEPGVASSCDITSTWVARWRGDVMSLGRLLVSRIFLIVKIDDFFPHVSWGILARPSRYQPLRHRFFTST